MNTFDSATDSDALDAKDKLFELTKWFAGPASKIVNAYNVRKDKEMRTRQCAQNWMSSLVSTETPFLRPSKRSKKADRSMKTIMTPTSNCTQI